jgi:hypothetical protein
MNPADERLSELLDKWLTSLDLHLTYSALDEGSYLKVQSWVKHERPSRWIIELARQKVLQLKERHAERVAMGDTKFADALELMGFLANLVGAQHIERFIPLAEPQSEGDLDATVERVSADTTIANATAQTEATRMSALITQPRRALGTEPTREMPRPKLDSNHGVPADSSRHSSSLRHSPKTAARRESKQTAHHSSSRSRSESRPSKSGRERTVVADAMRLLKWGRKWHELPELITRLADRPPLTEVRRILRENKATIEKS